MLRPFSFGTRFFTQSPLILKSWTPVINLRFGRSNGKKLRTAHTELNPDEFEAIEKTLHY